MLTFDGNLDRNTGAAIDVISTGQQIQLGGKVTGVGGCSRAVDMLTSECWKWDETNSHCVAYKASPDHHFVPVYSDVTHEWMAPGSECSAVSTSTRMPIASASSVATEHINNNAGKTMAPTVASTTTGETITAFFFWCYFHLI